MSDGRGSLWVYPEPVNTSFVHSISEGIPR